MIALLVASSLLRLTYIFRYRINSDEPQHLHVVWAWTQGLLPYRDVFDNHMPLFHLMYAPLLRVLGEQPQVLIVMRIAMVPLYVLALFALHRMARTLFSQRTAWWVVVLAPLVPGFFLCSLEFRADNLWMVLWLLTLVVALEGRATPPRSAALGLLLGAALGVSLKTVLMLVAVGGAAMGTLLLARRQAMGRPSLARCAGAALAGLMTPPLAVTALFASRGALEPYLYGTVWHNLTPGLGDWSTAPHRWIFFPALLLLLYGAAYVIARAAPGPALGTRRAFAFLATGIYLTGVVTLWPVRTRQDYLPVIPLITLFCTPLIVQLGNIRGRASRLRQLAPALVALAFLGMLVDRQDLRRARAGDSTELIGDVLRLTAPDEPVMDLKGEAVFRPRPFYYALERVTQERIRRGLIVDDIPERLIASRTTVAVGRLDLFPPRAARFLGENYVPVGTLRVAGQMIAPNPATGNRLLFDIRIPASYAIVTDGAPAGGELDGTPYGGPRFLDSGHHQYAPAPADGRIAVLWSPAAERGFSPFHPPELHG